jgi:DNA-binding NarL/FixJ family response regulator
MQLVRSPHAEIVVLSFPTDAPLTDAEHCIASALLAGKSNAEIARARGTTARTIANQIASLFRKLGVQSRAQLVADAALFRGSSRTPGRRH